MAISYKCLCCGHEQQFEDARAAYKGGWDVAPYFTCQPLCDLCPAAPVVIHGLSGAQERHRESHERWARDGRPKEFEWEAEDAANRAMKERQGERNGRA